MQLEKPFKSNLRVPGQYPLRTGTRTRIFQIRGRIPTRIKNPLISMTPLSYFESYAIRIRRTPVFRPGVMGQKGPYAGSISTRHLVFSRRNDPCIILNFPICHIIWITSTKTRITPDVPRCIPVFRCVLGKLGREITQIHYADPDPGRVAKVT